ncbi:hypothetical protein [Phreatobacter stygius]|uniref:Antifreeze protein n=1 Tax=Phreatobacter stygius TaxID=1940610 RepID=A0A4D7BE40_9HYPH|nr:hypothetical protein [Phreatobacter stygius]QCI68763.1 hypothetical protein E8M01_33745 [Phreatobacter stygius]
MFFWYMPRFTDSAMRAASLSASTAIAAGVTIAHRMAMMATPSGFDAASQHEAMRMVAEKVDAATEGSFDAVVETGRFMMRSAFGQVSPDDVAHGLMAIGVAAARPAARTAKANARRLTHKPR